jgi:predicted TIM-barrel fold metal-dependent hydrolase
VIVDTETHIMLFARNAQMNPGLSTRLKHYTWHEHDAELLVEHMDASGVDRTFLISYDGEDTRWSSEQRGFSLEDFGGGRKYTLLGVRRFPDRFWWFNTLKDPSVHPTLDLIERDVADGAVGFKLFPAFLQATLDDDAWRAIFTRIAELDKRLLISFEVVRPPLTHTLEDFLAQLSRVLGDLPSLRVALLHAGCADPLTTRGGIVRDLCARHENLYLSCSMPGEVWDDGVEYPYANLLARVERLRDTVSPERIMWATDWPWFDDRFLYQQGIDCFQKHASFFRDGELDLFLGDNAAHFMAHG